MGSEVRRFRVESECVSSGQYSGTIAGENRVLRVGSWCGCPRSLIRAFRFQFSTCISRQKEITSYLILRCAG